MSEQPALGAQRCLGAKKAVKLEKSLGAQHKGINSIQSRGGGWGAFFCFVCLFVFKCFLFLKHCAGFQKEQRVESHSVLMWRNVAFGLLWWFCRVCYNS